MGSLIPWGIDIDDNDSVVRLYDGEGQYVGVTGMGDKAEEDGNHIVRCVNLHEELVAGLKLALEAIEDECAYQEKHRGGATELLWRSRDEVRALLAKLEE